MFGNIHATKEAVFHEMNTLEESLQGAWSDDTWRLLVEARKKFFLSERQHEIFLKQKARINWLSAGDKNTKYFHSTLMERRRTNPYSKMLLNAQFSRDDLKQRGKEYFEKLFQEEGCVRDENLLNFIPPLVSMEENLMLCAIPDALEIKEVVFSMAAENAPGPDGFSAGFFVECWDTVNMDVINAVQVFFKGDELPRGWKATFLALIPKKDDPESFSEFRPISLCNVCYKFIAKIMANRLGTILPKLVSPEQGAFVSGRLIHENVALTQELVQSLDGGLQGGNVILNIDMDKAYDRLNWDFLFAVLQKFGFSMSWVDLIKKCVKDNYFSVLIDGSSSEFFISSRGLRQGDPISPALYVLAEEVLSRGLTYMVENKLILPYHVK